MGIYFHNTIESAQFNSFGFFHKVVQWSLRSILGQFHQPQKKSQTPAVTCRFPYTLHA